MRPGSATRPRTSESASLCRGAEILHFNYGSDMFGQVTAELIQGWGRCPVPRARPRQRAAGLRTIALMAMELMAKELMAKELMAKELMAKEQCAGAVS